MATLMQLWNDWELQVLVLLSFMFQIFLFFTGGLRQRNTNTVLRFLIWLAYLVADFIAVYALGQLSRQKADAMVKESHQLTFFWTPFLLIHLGGQDTITAFSIEDNELWLRHLLNLLVQVGLALYVFWKSAAHNQFLASAVFAFIAGIIKYGERTWALKSASQKALRSANSEHVGQFPELFPLLDEQELRYLTVVKLALSSSPGVRNLFVGRKLEQMEQGVQSAVSGYFYNQVSKNGELVFKILEIELGMMYENLYTKARVIRTWAGAILRFVTLISLLVAFVLFLTRNKQWHLNRVDVAISYTLFIGAFCLEVCAIFTMVIMSIWTWALFRSWKCPRLATAAWYIFRTLRPESGQLWSNSMGQYNFLDSCLSDNVIGKMMNLVGAKDIWRNFRHIKYADVKVETKKLIFEDKCLGEIFTTYESSCLCASPTSGIGAALDIILRKPFEEAILSLHIYTDIFLHRVMNPLSATSCDNTSERRRLMRACRTLSEYMCYLLAVHPEMLPVSSSVRDVLEKASDAVAEASSTASSKYKLLEKLATDRDLNVTSDPVETAGFVFRGLEEEAVHSHDSLQVLVRAWVGVLLYAAGKSRGEVHAKQLSMGGELGIWVYLKLSSSGQVL
ncbi:hypothetical protein ACP70R_045358 [Stipagrostis hirtigluma subsp. patula]